MSASLSRPARWMLAAPFVAVVLVCGAMGLARSVGQEVRTTPLTPAEELETFKLGDNRLAVELVASEPQLNSPVAICWDADGRMYVAEMIDYPTGPTAGQIRLLEDRDHDGRYEHATVFAQGLRFPNGVLPAQGGVFVTAAPDLLFLRDKDGDGKADEKAVVFTGFAEGNQQLRANGLTWGLDGWIYGANGRSDGAVRRPNDPPERAVSIRGRDFRFRPDASTFEATSGQSQFGQAGDDWGNRFLSWNTIPIRHAIFDQAFLDRNPRLSGNGVRDIADPADTGRVFPLSPRPQTFNRERTDFYNALCGLSIYRGDALGRDYDGSAFVGESLTNLVHRRALMSEGPTFVSRRGEHDREFLASSDPWFHPVYTTTGPDGALYIVDFYRRWVEHPAFVPETQRANVDWRQGEGHGRIWKVSRRENIWPPKPGPRLSRQSTMELVKHLESPNGWWRDTAQRLILERKDPRSVPQLRAVLGQSRSPQAKVHALATLDALGQLEDGALLRAMEDGAVQVRQFAIKLAAPRLANSATLRQALLGMADFPSPLVRFQLALSLGASETPEKVPALVKLANLEARDPIIAVAIVGSLGRGAGGFLTQLVASNPEWRQKPSEHQMRLLNQAAATACASGDAAQLGACLAIVAPTEPSSPGPGDLAILAGMAQGLADRGQSLRGWFTSPPSELKPRLAALAVLLHSARTLAANENASLEHRRAAIEVLGLLDAGSGGVLLALVDPVQTQEIQSAAAEALAHADAATAAQVFARWPQLTAATRRSLAGVALRSPTLSSQLVTSLEGADIRLKELDPSVRDALAAVRDQQLKPRIAALLAAQQPAVQRQQVIDKYAPVLEQHGDKARGAALFEKQCLICHSLQGQGQRVGPDLSGVGAKPRETLLVDVLDPNRQVTPDFVSYTLVTREGQVLTGLVVSETAGSVTLRRAEGAQDVVLREQIEELRATGKSLMPEGLEANLSAEDLADLFEFLAQPDARLFSRKTE